MRTLILALAMTLLVGTAYAGDPGPPDPEPERADAVVAAPWLVAVTSPPAEGEWGAEPEPTKYHVGLTAGQSSWDCTSNNCGVEAGSEDYETVAIAAGFTAYSVRLEIEGGYRRHQIHGLNGKRCRGYSHHPTGISNSGSPRRTKCQTDRDLRVWDLTLGAYPTYEVLPWLSIYGGGGLGIVFADGLGQIDHAGVGKVAAGIELAAYKGLSIDAGYKALWALGDMKLDGYSLDDYASHGPYAGLRYRF